MESLQRYIMESRIIKNRKFIKMLEKAGFNDVSLEEDGGTVYVYDKVGDVPLYDSSWGGAWFNSQTPEHWVLDIAIKYFEEGDIEDINMSKNINPNFDYLYELADKFKDDEKVGDYFTKRLDKYIKYFK